LIQTLGDALAMLRLFQELLVGGLLRNEISVSTEGMSAPTRTTNGALRTPRSFTVLFSFWMRLASDS